LTLDELLQRVKSKKITACIIGLGRVGLPLSTVFAINGLKVYGVDIDEKKLESIRKTQSPFYDIPLQETLEKANKSGNFIVVNSLDQIQENIDIIIITTGTPNTIENEVDYNQLYGALEEVCKISIRDKFIILRSTLPPKTTEEIIIPFLEDKTGLKAGIDFGIAMCPERILEGQAIKEIYELPEIIGGVNDISNQIASNFFKIINPEKEVLHTSPAGAELAKLFANIYRYISFALSNEFAIWAERYGLDASELIKISNYKYSRSNIPIPGFVGGPCLSKDGSFLDKNTTFASIVSTAWKLNESIPKHIVNNLRELVGIIFNKKIAVLGMSFKSGSDDIRQSPAIKLIDILKSYHAEVLVHDPHVKGTLSIENVLQKPEIVIIATNHKEFKNLIPELNQCGCKLIYDVWGMFDQSDFSEIKYVKFGQGIPSNYNKH